MFRRECLIRTVIARTAADMDCLGPTWRFLCSNQDSTVFQSFSWNRLAARAFAATEQPYCVMVSADSGDAIIPAAISRNGNCIVLLGEALFDYRDVLAAGDENVLRLAWDQLARLKLPISVTAIRSSSLSRWQGLGITPFTESPQVRCSEISAEEFCARHRRLGRLFRQCERLGFSIVSFDGRESRFLRWIYQRKAIQFAKSKNNLFASDRRVEFIVDIAALKPERCDIFALQNDQNTIAALVTFRDHKVRRFYTTYYDQEWSKHSPGQILTYEVTRRSLVEGLDCDYMTGEQQHKTRLATSSIPLYRAEASAEMLLQVASEPSSRKAA